MLIEQEEKLKIQNDLHILSERLARVSESIAQKMAGSAPSRICGCALRLCPRRAAGAGYPDP